MKIYKKYKKIAKIFKNTNILLIRYFNLRMRLRFKINKIINNKKLFRNRN